MDDESIVALYLCRDQAALTQTADKYGCRLRALANSIVEDELTAQECENDTYLEAWHSIPPHEPRTYLFPFLARITRHIALDCCRKRSRVRRSAIMEELTQEMEACIPAPDDTADQVDGILLGQSITAYLRTLPEDQRNVFLRRYWYLDSVAAISRRFGFSQSKVKSILFRSRTGLRNHLIKEGYLL